MTKNIIISRISLRSLLGIMLIAVAMFFLGSTLVVRAEILSRQLQVGMSGSDVTALQTFLATDPSLYPQGLVTGYFGLLTKAAVSNFQSRNGISAVGRVGPATLPVLNLQMAQGVNVTSSAKAPMITSILISASRNTVTVGWNTDEFAKGLVYYSTSPLITYERQNSVDVSGFTASTDSNFRTTQSVTITGLQSNTIYYYLVYTTDQAGNVSVSWPSTFQTTN